MAAKKISNEARRIVERYLRQHGHQTALSLWGGPDGGATDSAEDPATTAERQSQGETPEQTSEA